MGEGIVTVLIFLPIRTATRLEDQAKGHPGAHSERSGLLLRKLLGPLPLESTCAGDNDRPFYKATISLNTLALVDPLIEGQPLGHGKLLTRDEIFHHDMLARTKQQGNAGAKMK